MLLALASPPELRHLLLGQRRQPGRPRSELLPYGGRVGRRTARPALVVHELDGAVLYGHRAARYEQLALQEQKLSWGAPWPTWAITIIRGDGAEALHVVSSAHSSSVFCNRKLKSLCTKLGCKLVISLPLLLALAGALTCPQVVAQGQCSAPAIRTSVSDPHVRVMGGYCAVSCGVCKQGQRACIDKVPPGACGLVRNETSQVFLSCAVEQLEPAA